METKFTPGPWDYVKGTEHHGPYVTSEFGTTICDFYVMSAPSFLSSASGGPSRPILHLHEMAAPNAALVAAAPDLYAALEDFRSSVLLLLDRGVAITGGELVEAFKQADAALKKARGE